ncbi:tyrosine-protein kinase STK-like isoform X2 [Mytilus californianus]|uniref:tyrosine-protein kinase STK-like isoform X2 n=1 Tax=Mytilus californianus TaxID=6549 RepID=UPI002245B7AC|nr:tyrosine-protein kinase STK-like isoform X2 [Mytilus californianus]
MNQIKGYEDVKCNTLTTGVGDGLCCQLTGPCPKLPSLVQFRELEVARESVQLMKKIGSGSFGDVHAGKWKNTVDVAVKILKRGVITVEDFYLKAKLMHEHRHRKFVQLLAVCSTTEPIWIITELMVNGSLLDYLRINREKSIKLPVIIDMAAQIADGMAYLETENIVHRDLRASSIFVGERNDVKVGHFGIVYETDEYIKFPIKWTAPEAAFDRTFSIKSDVWSYGVLLYELITFGRCPYPGIKGDDLMSEVDSGLRMSKPTEGPIPCPDPYYDIMLQCWKKLAETRPTFAFLHGYFDNYFATVEESYREATCD